MKYVVFLLLCVLVVDSYRICHFNDAYESDSLSLLCEFKYELDKLNCSVKTFGGDAFFHSDNSIRSNGSVMAFVLNELGVTVAVPGNHEFDMGVDVAMGLFNISRFPWILWNVPSLGLQGRYEDDRLVYVGLWGLGLRSVLPGDIGNIEEFSGRRNGSKLLVALSHMDLGEDLQLKGVDLVLGGHDHDVVSPVFNDNGVAVVKSLSDFREIQVVDVDDDNGLRFSKVSVSAGNNSVCDLRRLVDGYMSKFVDRSVGVPFEIDTRDVRLTSTVASIRRLLGEFLSGFVDSDMIMLNAGVFRGNRVFHVGEYTLSFVMDVPLVEMVCPRDVVWLMLHYGLLTCENRCGYRAHVVSKTSLQVSMFSGIVLDDDKQSYRIVTTKFQSEGKDGYNLLLGCNLTGNSIHTHDFIRKLI
jgi:5'-nucleotidase